MSSLTINPNWNSEINQVENGEPITGGALGNANIATRQLGENIFYLKQKTENDLLTKANKADVYTKTEADGRYALKATTISGYNITDAYTKSQIDNLIDSKMGDLSTLKTTDKTQLVKSINEVFDNTKSVVDLYNKNVEASAGANGWTTDLVVENGLTQKQINAQVAVKFIKASEVGLTKWAEFKKPPYTTAEYKQAYDNGVNLTNAIKAAHDAGYSSVVLERGNYPLCYIRSMRTKHVKNDSTNFILDGLHNFEVDFNGSTLFVIYDSNNRSPYDADTTNPVYTLPGNVLFTRNTTDLELKNGVLRGDMYNRSWVSGEETLDNTAGILIDYNCINTIIRNFEFTGFNADGISAFYDGITLFDMNLWYAGGLDKTSGGEVAQVDGSYRTNFFDLSGKDIKRNSVQLSVSWGLKHADFRNPDVDVFFFDANKVLISTEVTRQSENIVLPKNTRYVRFVVYGDERTDATVTYRRDDLGSIVVLATGKAFNATVSECRFYENMRGGISNLIGDTTIQNCDFYDIGQSKIGFKNYANPTRYAINFEDTTVTRLYINNVRIKNVPQGILSNVRVLNVSNCLIQNIQYSAIACYNSRDVKVNFNLIEDAWYDCFGLTNTTTGLKRRNIIFAHNTVHNARLIGNFKQISDAIIDISHNIFDKCKLTATGDGDNLKFDKNIIIASGSHSDLSGVKNALSCEGNIFKHTTKLSGEAGISYFRFHGKLSNANYINSIYNIEYSNQENQETVVNGTRYNLLTTNDITLMLRNKSLGWTGHVDNFTFKNNIFDVKRVLAFGLSDSDNQYDTTLTFDNCVFNNTSYVAIRKDESASYAASTTTVVFKDCVFNLDNASYVVQIIGDLLGVCDIKFINCAFRSLTQKNIALIQGKLTNVSATCVGCRFTNVINTDNITVIAGQVKVTYDPPSLATASQQSTTVTLTGAKLGDNISVSFNKALQGTRMWGEVTAPNAVTVYHRNDTGVTVDLTSGTLTIKIV